MQSTSSNSVKVKSLSLNSHYITDPPRVFNTLCAQRHHCLLLESAEVQSKRNEKSIMLIDAAVKVQCRGFSVEVIAISTNGKTIVNSLSTMSFDNAKVVHNNDSLCINFNPPDGFMDEESRLRDSNPFSVLRYLQQSIQHDSENILSVFLGGVIAYDMIAVTEKLPDVPNGENDCPDYLFYIAETLLVIDHQSQTTELIANVFFQPESEPLLFAASQRLGTIKALIENISHSSVLSSSDTDIDKEVSVDIEDTIFCQQVEGLKQHIVNGDVFQVVPSRVFSIACPNPLKAYSLLKQQNPSPYMFYMKDADFILFGASPESALKYSHSTRDVEVYPIAGTRSRARNFDDTIHYDLDSRVELELRNDKKERAEHLMLVDLARNDISRIAEPGSRHVAELLKVDRYSHVMHLVSRVKGKLRDGLDALNAYQACMNMGTLVGAPKIRAAELIRTIEQKRRGSYGGAIGYLNGCGDMDTCIVIRSAFVKNNIAYIQAGAGVVFDSIPQAEADETRGKAQAVIRAIQSSYLSTSESVGHEYTTI